MSTVRYWPLGKGRIITSPFGPRPGEFHKGVDFGFPGGSALRPVYAVQSGTVIFAGPASGYGGPDPAGWLVIDSTDAEGGGCLEYGHIVRRCNKGDHIEAGQIAAGQGFEFFNTSSGALTINSSAGNLVKTLAAGGYSRARSLQATPTSAAHWVAS